MKKRLRLYRNGTFPGNLLFVLGFVTGCILPNLFYKMKWKQDTAAALYLLGIYPGEENAEYLWKVVRMRGSWFLLAAGSGLTIFGVLIAGGIMVLTGMTISMLLTMSILQFGLNGGLIGLGLLFPQWMIYLPCIFAGCGIIYESSAGMWRSRKFLPGEITAYMLKILICFVFFIGGILLEVYCNPVITGILVQNLKFF